jgi:crotonobetainyl-CoA:carnitine CoA-transferase CaiB-like acyl-CoA transferase
LAQLGIDARSFVADHGVTVWASITAHGRHTEAAMRVGLGDDAAAAGGLVASTDGGPAFLGDAIADPLTGLVAAAAVVERLSTDSRALLDISLARTAASFAERGDQPIVRSVPNPAPPVPRVAAASRFELGAHNDEVLNDRHWQR